MAIVHGYIQPNKNTIINVQESLLLCNFIILCLFLILNETEALNTTAVNVMVGLSFLHCLLILVYHMFAFIPCTNIKRALTNVRNYAENKFCYGRQRQSNNENISMQIPEVGHNFAEFREPLIGED